MIKAVITNVDGTLCDYIGIAWARYLGANKLIDEDLFKQHEHLVEAYNGGLIGHTNFIREWVILYGQIIRGRKEKEFTKYAKKFFASFIRTIPEHSISLVKHFKSKGYKVFAITVSPILPSRMVLRHMGIADFASTDPEIKDGKYTGEMLTGFHEVDDGKKSIVNDFIASYEINTSRSFALGDTIYDIPLLESVAYPIAINPKGRLVDYATENGFWVANYDNVLDVVSSIEREGKKSTFEQMKFIFEAGALKFTPRSGWSHIQVDAPETVAEHVYRSSVIAYLLAVEEGEDPAKCTSALVMHELGECRIGDINRLTAKYWEGKADAEGAAVADMTERLDARKKQKVLEAVHCFGSEKIARICSDADMLENLVTAREYEFKGYKHAREWIKRIAANLHTRTAKKWARAIGRMDPNSWWLGAKRSK